MPIAAAAAGHAEPLSFVTFLLALVGILIGAKVLGEVSQRLGQPPVLGEIVAGLILGPYALGIVPEHQIIHLLAEIGVLILLFEIGLETDLGDLIKVGGTAVRVAIIGVVLPYVGGHVFAAALGEQGLVPIVIGAALTATSVGITARVLSDIGKLDTDVARIILGAAVVDDILGIVLLALVQTLGQEGSLSVGLVAWSLIAAFGFLGLALFLGQWAAPAMITLVDRARVRGMLITMAISFAFILGLLADVSGSAPLIGAMAAGMLLARTHRKEIIEEQIRPIADLFTPIFFVSVGAGVNLALLTPFDPDNWGTLGLAAGLIAIAIVGKLAAGLGTSRGKRLIVGVGMIPRGEVGLIFAGVGRSAGILSPALFGAVVAMVLITTVIVPPLLRVVFDRQERRDEAEAGD